VLNTLSSLGHVGGAALASHLDVDKVAFTGSTATGRKIMEASSKSNLKKVRLHAFISQLKQICSWGQNIIGVSRTRRQISAINFRVRESRGRLVFLLIWVGHNSATYAPKQKKNGASFFRLVWCSKARNDISIAATWTALGILYNTGQDCTAGSRVYVQESVYDKFVTLLVEKAQQFVVGDGFDEKAAGGPVVSHACRSSPNRNSNVCDMKISKSQYDKIWMYIERGKAEGAKVILGGEKRPGKGFFIDPTSTPLTCFRPFMLTTFEVFTDIKSDMNFVKYSFS